MQVTKYSLELPEPARTTVPNRLGDIIRACGEYGASYPDIVQMMIEAEQQHNLIGEFGIDRMPQAGRMYFRDEDGDGQGDDERRIGSPAMIPNLFDKLDEDELRELEHESDEQLENLSFEDVSDSDDDSFEKEREAARETARNATSGETQSAEKQQDQAISDQEDDQPGNLTDEDFTQINNSASDTEVVEEVDMSRMDSGFTSGVKKIFKNPFTKK